jgi:hypothetical protein
MSCIYLIFFSSFIIMILKIGTNCAPLFADLFFYSYEAYFMQGLLKKNEKKLTRSLNLTFRYTDDVFSAPGYGLYISQLIRYSRACGSYQDFLDRGLLLTRRLLNQGFLLVKLKSSLRKFYGRHLVDRYGISVVQMTTDMLHLS